MRLGVVTTSYPRRAGDFAGHFVARHAEELLRHGHEVEVIAAGDEASPRTEQQGSLQITRLRSALFFDGGAPEAIAARGMLAALPTAARWIGATSVQARGWSAACAHWLVPSAIAAISAPGPLLAIAHGGDVHTLRRAGLLAPVLATLLARGARLAFVSEELRALARASLRALPSVLLRRFDDAAIVQPMGVDCARWAEAARAPRPQARRYVLVLGRLVAIKGVELAIDAFAALADAELELVIIGEGPARASLEARAREHGLRVAERVHFFGALPTDARAPYLAHAAAVLVPSRALDDGRAEGTPQVALEALAAGVPLLAASTGGLAALPPPVQLRDDRDPARWAAALAALLRDPPSSEELRALARPHDWPAVAAALWSHWMR